VKTGVVSDPEAIRSSVLLLSALDLFDEIQVVEETQGDGTVRVVFDVVETPKVGELVFVTRSPDSTVDIPLTPVLAKSLQGVAALPAGEPFREKSLTDATARMTDWLHANAYRRAAVEVEAQVGSSGAHPSTGVRDIKVRVSDSRQETLV